MKFKVEKIIDYEFDRDVVLKSCETGQTITAFDESEDDFTFMKVGQTYECKIETTGNIVKHQKAGVNAYSILGRENIGEFEWERVKNEQGTILYTSGLDLSEDATDFYLDQMRYNLIQVDKVIDRRFLAGGSMVKLVEAMENTDYDSADFIDDDMW